MKRRRFPKRVYLAILRKQRMVCGCGCREKMSGAEGIEFDHDKSLWLDGADTPENLVARRKPCHDAKTRREASARAKVKRIILKSGLKKPAKNARERALERMQRWRDMP